MIPNAFIFCVNFIHYDLFFPWDGITLKNGVGFTLIFHSEIAKFHKYLQRNNK